MPHFWQVLVSVRSLGATPNSCCLQSTGQTVKTTGGGAAKQAKQLPIAPKS
jgi:hypothetical protein